MSSSDQPSSGERISPAEWRTKFRQCDNDFSTFLTHFKTRLAFWKEVEERDAEDFHRFFLAVQEAREKLLHTSNEFVAEICADEERQVLQEKVEMIEKIERLILRFEVDVTSLALESRKDEELDILKRRYCETMALLWVVDRAFEELKSGDSDDDNIEEEEGDTHKE